MGGGAGCPGGRCGASSPSVTEAQPVCVLTTAWCVQPQMQGFPYAHGFHGQVSVGSALTTESGSSHLPWSHYCSRQGWRGAFRGCVHKATPLLRTRVPRAPATMPGGSPNHVEAPPSAAPGPRPSHSSVGKVHPGGLGPSRPSPSGCLPEGPAPMPRPLNPPTSRIDAQSAGRRPARTSFPRP